MKWVVGLGNPGKEYSNTRHNVGFMFIDKLLEHYNCENIKSKLGGLYSETVINGEKIIFLKPTDYRLFFIKVFDGSPPLQIIKTYGIWQI